MTTWQIILIPAVLLVIGLIRQIVILFKESQKIRLVEEFLEKFTQWCEGDGKDKELYNWMLDKSHTVQTTLGSFGYAEYRNSARGIQVPDYPLVLAGIPEIYQDCTNAWPDELICAVDSHLRQFIGAAKEQKHREKMRVFNPPVLLCGGVAWLMELLLVILSETKIITTSRRAIIADSQVFFLLSGVGAIIAIIAGLMAIVTGCEKFATIVTGWMT